MVIQTRGRPQQIKIGWQTIVSCSQKIQLATNPSIRGNVHVANGWQMSKVLDRSCAPVMVGYLCVRFSFKAAPSTSALRSSPSFHPSLSTTSGGMTRSHFE